MTDPGPSKSRLLAALDFTQVDDAESSPLPPPPSSLPMSLPSSSQYTSQKRKGVAEYPGMLLGPMNKRLTSRPPRHEYNRLPSGLLASTQSPDTSIADPTLTPEEREILETQSLITAAVAAASPSPWLEHEFQLQYTRDAPLTRLDIGGEDQDQRLAEFVSKSIDNLGHGMQVKDGMKYLGLKDAKDIIPGLEIRLIPHQVIGVSCDEMGLGKTVQMIATMAMNMPSLDEHNHTTLIVVPPRFCISVHIHHGKTKLKTLTAMREKDVIITTYQMLVLDFVVKDPNIDVDEEAEWLIEHGGLLARMKWYRVVLDEAQFIRNRTTRASKVVAQLRAKYRWMLTGTPVTNNLADLYGLIRFGRFDHGMTGSPLTIILYAKVQVHDALLAGARAQEILKPILLRRTKESKLEGKPLLTLPPKTVEIETLQFSEEERMIYDDFERQAKIRVNKYIREGTIVKNHSAVLVMILRLRQLCCHPTLILAQAEQFDDPTLLVSGESEKELGRAKRLMGLDWIARIKKRYSVTSSFKLAMDRARAIESDFTNGADEESPCVPSATRSTRIMAGFFSAGTKYALDMSQSAIAHDGIFGYGNEQQNIQAEKVFEDAAAKGLRPCPVCKKMTDISPNAIFLSSAFEPTPEDLRAFTRAERDRKRASRVRKVSPPPVKPKVKPAPARMNLIELSSDEELPDSVSQILAGSKKRAKPDDSEDVGVFCSDHVQTLKTVVMQEKPPISSAPGSDDDMDDEKEIKKIKRSPSPKQGKKRVSSSPAKEAQRPNQSTVATWRRGDDNMEPSTKMIALIEQLRVAEAAGDKTIVYSQWTSMLDLLETLLARYGVPCLRYDGKMRSEVRDAALVAFRRTGGPRVILISTKCGGVGLNLVSANRVVNMDLSWNFAAESQAYDRVHRLGQEKDVFVKRLVVENTIEERMLRLQDVKTGLADAALGEGRGVKLHKLSVKEIKAVPLGMTPAQKPNENRQPRTVDDGDNNNGA
ncbi:P-loop containing nucleoside triphosphate hydrolase protein [Gloeopeniophorella convolvens]|nr:P-loop containing nucleoside triphosphate hydrolase protein [Gloeopeniophorella convolvens]